MQINQLNHHMIISIINLLILCQEYEKNESSRIELNPIWKRTRRSEEKSIKRKKNDIYYQESLDLDIFLKIITLEWWMLMISFVIWFKIWYLVL